MRRTGLRLQQQLLQFALDIHFRAVILFLFLLAIMGTAIQFPDSNRLIKVNFLPLGVTGLPELADIGADRLTKFR